MRLIVKDYISMFKEEQEMESLLEKILIMNDYSNIVVPQKGVGQLGVDFSAQKNGEVYLFVLKQQDIDRTNWDVGINAVRPTLNEILDSYIPQRLSDCNKKINIVLCTNGNIKQNVKPNWDNYIKNNSKDNISYDFWGIDELVNLTELFLINEYIFDEDIRTELRKSLYFFEEDFELKYFDNLLIKLIEKIDIKNRRRKIYKKSIIVYTIITKMCIAYSIKQNSKIAVNMSEKSLIRYWNFISKNNLFEKDIEMEYLHILSGYYTDSCKKYIEEIKKVYKYKPSFPIYNSIEYRILIYEAIGIITNYTYYLYYYNGLIDEVEENINLLIMLINNNVSFYYPLYDSNAIEINALVYLLKEVGNDQGSNIVWILLNKIVSRIVKSKSYYPVEYEDYQKALDMFYEKEVEECKATLLITNLIEWLYIYKKDEDINEIMDVIYKKYPNITLNTLQIIPDLEELYLEGNFHGSSITYIIDYKNKKQVNNIIKQLKKEYKLSKYKFYKYSAMLYLFIASRNYRLPLPSTIIYKD